MTETATREAPQSTAIKRGFNQVTGNNGVALFVLNEGANYSKSMKVLEEANLRPLKHQEALLLLMNDEPQKNALKGKWFYLEGKGLDKKLELYTINDKGELVEREGNISVERTVRVWNGTNPLFLVVGSDGDAAQNGRRFGLFADDGPHDVAPVVVGLAKAQAELKPIAIAEAPESKGLLVSGVTLKEFNAMLRRSRDEMEGLSKTVRPELVENTQKLLRTLEIKA